MLRQQHVQQIPCSDNLPYVHTSCLGNSGAMDTELLPGVVYSDGDLGNFMIGQIGVYDGSGYTITLNTTR